MRTPPRIVFRSGPDGRINEVQVVLEHEGQLYRQTGRLIRSTDADERLEALRMAVRLSQHILKDAELVSAA